MPWIFQEKFTKSGWGITYEMESSFPEPFLVYGDSLYIPNQYNTLVMIENLPQSSYKKFVLSKNVK